MYWHRTISNRFTTNEWIWIRCCQCGVANKNLKFSIAASDIFISRIPSRCSRPLLRLRPVCVKALKIHKEICLCSIGNAVNRFRIVFLSFVFFFSHFNLDDRIEFSNTGKDSDIVEELFESLCANFYPYLSVSCCRCYCTYLRDICILNYCVSKWNENSNKYLGLKFLFAREEIKWPQTSAEIMS